MKRLLIGVAVVALCASTSFAGVKWPDCLHEPCSKVMLIDKDGSSYTAKFSTKDAKSLHNGDVLKVKHPASK